MRRPLAQEGQASYSIQILRSFQFFLSTLDYRKKYVKIKAALWYTKCILLFGHFSKYIQRLQSVKRASPLYCQSYDWQFFAAGLIGVYGIFVRQFVSANRRHLKIAHKNIKEGIPDGKTHTR